jgi:hypothetical protein
MQIRFIAGTTPDEVVPGYYFYNGSKWSPAGNNSNEIIYTQSSEIRRPVFTA